MLVFVSASGAVLYVYFCMKKEAKQRKYLIPKLIINQESRKSKTTSMYECGDDWSELGYMSEHHIEKTIAGFGEVMKRHFGHMKHPVVLLADNLR